MSVIQTGCRYRLADVAGERECFGCGIGTTSTYRDLPLCLDCQVETTLLNQLFDLPAEQPPADLLRVSFGMASLALALTVLGLAVYCFAILGCAHWTKGAW
jgi:hypothetical protein